eukprot:4633691-Pyramimonas_sp.AAC.1
MADKFSLAVACQIADRSSNAHADCKAAIAPAPAMPPQHQQLRAGKVFAGVSAFAGSLEGFRHVESIQHVKAHRSDDAI